MPADRLEVGGPVGQLMELLEEGVLVVAGLIEGTAIERVRPRPPCSAAIPPDLAGLHLDDEDAPLRIADDDVRLAVADRASLA
jgi:hypothetical protein